MSDEVSQVSFTSTQRAYAASVVTQTTRAPETNKHSQMSLETTGTNNYLRTEPFSLSSEDDLGMKQSSFCNGQNQNNNRPGKPRLMKLESNESLMSVNSSQFNEKSVNERA
jgi:hypothetical protein